MIDENGSGVVEPPSDRGEGTPLVVAEVLGEDGEEPQASAVVGRTTERQAPASADACRLRMRLFLTG